MNTFRFFWTTHKWTGITLALVFALTAVTGFLLLFKKRAAWIQPPTQKGQAAPVESWLSMADLWKTVEAQKHPDFQTFEDINRVDVRTGKRVYEMQVSASTGEVLGVATRTSDWLENLHDGSFIGEPFRDYVMPLVAVGLLFLVFSGIWLWLEPVLKRRRRQRRKARQIAS